jgi:hypothetical protein
MKNGQKLVKFRSELEQKFKVFCESFFGALLSVLAKFHFILFHL